MILVEKMFLFEHNVVNPNTIDAFVKKFVSKTKPENGKTWFQKKLRSFLMNDDSYLQKLTATQIATMQNLPDYITSAAERGETLYSFEPNNNQKIDQLIQGMNHISDWFNALFSVASRKVNNPSQVDIEDKNLANKWLEKLSKIPLADITEIADQWFSHMGTRIKTEKDGVETVMHWNTGFYAVRFTEKNTMISDGLDLQNCLQYGTYWEDVKSGKGAVYAIRKPNDEAVVGIRVNLKDGVLAECKGKNNKPVIAAYVPYVIDFLNKMGWQVAGNGDLEAAGIEVHNGKLGSFEDIADLIYDHNGNKIWQTGDRFLAKTKNITVSGRMANNVLTLIDFDEGLTDKQTKDVIAVLNILNHPPTPNGRLKSYLEEYQIYFNNGKYGDIETVGEKVFSVDGLTGYRIDSGSYAQVLIYELNEINEKNFEGELLISKNKIQTYLGDLASETLIKILNALKIPLSDTYNGNLNTPVINFAKKDVYYADGKYGTLDDIGKLDVHDDRISFVRIGKDNWTLVIDGVSGDRTPGYYVLLRRGNLEYENSKSILEKDRIRINALMRQLAVKYKVKYVKDAKQFGMLNTKQGLVADFNSLISVASKTPDVSYYQPFDWRNPKTESLFEITGNICGPNMTPEQQTILYNTFKAKDDGVKIINENPDLVYDIEVKNIKIEFATYNIMLVEKAKIFTDLKIINQIKKDFQEYIKKALTFLSTLKYANITCQQTGFDGSGKLSEKIREIEKRTGAAVAERRRNPDKYATDLSSRFAAMNAFKKR
jgi:hypothetical protein